MKSVKLKDKSSLSHQLSDEHEWKGKSLRAPEFGLTASPVQRAKKNENKEKKNEKGEGSFPTWNAIQKSQPKVSSEIMDEVAKVIGKSFNKGRFGKAWNNVRKSVLKKKRDLSLDKMDEVKEAMMGAYKRSAKSSEGYEKRGEFSENIQKALNEGRKSEDSFELSQNAQTAKLALKNMNHFKFDQNMSKEDRFQRHLSTWLLAKYGGIEAQASLKRDGKNIMVSSNQDESNQSIQDENKKFKNVLYNAKTFLLENGIKDLNTKELNQNRNLRHTAKLVSRGSKIVDPKTSIEVPERGDNTKDGKHAELRIVDHDQWNKDDYTMPKGTKYPCGCCYSYMNSEKLKVGKEMGPIWTACASLHNQLSMFNDNVIDVNAIKDKDGFFKALKQHLEEGLKNGKMGYGVHKDGNADDSYDADSDDDIDEKELKGIVKDVLGKDDDIDE